MFGDQLCVILTFTSSNFFLPDLIKGPIKDPLQKYDRDSGLANVYLHIHFPSWSSARL